VCNGNGWRPLVFLSVLYPAASNAWRSAALAMTYIVTEIAMACLVFG
jgi:hypothetical protein